MKDWPKKHYPSVADFLAHARDLIRRDAYAWNRRHQTGHNVTESEALRALFYPTRAQADRKKTDAYVVWNLERDGRLIRVCAHTEMRPDGDKLVISSAFEESRGFGS
jgi:hypothetical protein